MSLELSGTTGLKGVAGSVSAPSIVGDDTNTGVSFPAADTIKFSTGGVERMQITNSGVSGTGVGSSIFAEAVVDGGGGSPSVTRSTGFGSLTDNGTGDFTLALSSAQPDSNFTVVGATGYTSNNSDASVFVVERKGSNGDERPNTTTAVNFGTVNDSLDARDVQGNIHIACIRG